MNLNLLNLQSFDVVDWMFRKSSSL